MSTPTAEAVESVEAEDLQYVNRDGLAALLSVSRSQTYRLEHNQGLPSPTRFGKSVRWRISDIRKWLLSGNIVSCPRRTQHHGGRDVEAVATS